MKTCAITGHRPGKLRIGSEDSPAGGRLKQVIYDRLHDLIGQGVRRFYIGGALGVDLWAGEILINMRDNLGFGELEVVMAIPFEGYDSRWSKQQQGRMARLRAACNWVVVVAGGEASGPCGSPGDLYLKRNRYLVDQADCILAVYDEASSRSGTGMTVRYGQKKNLPIFLIQPRDHC